MKSQDGNGVQVSIARPIVYKVSFTAVFSRDIGKEQLSDAVFDTLEEKAPGLAMLSVDSIQKCRNGEEKAQEVLKKVMSSKENLDKINELMNGK